LNLGGEREEESLAIEVVIVLFMGDVSGHL
jgi:hypothetical protein